MELAGHVTRVEDVRNAYRTPVGEIARRTPRCDGDFNNKLDLKKQV